MIKIILSQMTKDKEHIIDEWHNFLKEKNLKFIVIDPYVYHQNDFIVGQCDAIICVERNK